MYKIRCYIEQYDYAKQCSRREFEFGDAVFARLIKNPGIHSKPEILLLNKITRWQVTGVIDESSIEVTDIEGNTLNVCEKIIGELTNLNIGDIIDCKIEYIVHEEPEAKIFCSLSSYSEKFNSNLVTYVHVINRIESGYIVNFDGYKALPSILIIYRDHFLDGDGGLRSTYFEAVYKSGAGEDLVVSTKFDLQKPRTVFDILCKIKLGSILVGRVETRVKFGLIVTIRVNCTQIKILLQE